MKWTCIIVAVVMVMIVGLGCQTSRGDSETIVLATTTSTYDSGLLHHLLPQFTAQYGIEVDVIALGTGQAIETGRRGDCDVILVHARSLEDQFVADGYGKKRWGVMYNDFVLVGPVDDGVNIGDNPDIIHAMVKMISHIQTSGTQFMSRGDNSGTHHKEMELWAAMGIDNMDSYPWYASLGQGMGDTLIAASEMGAYVLADRGTYLAMASRLQHLEIVFRGDEMLFNPYGIIPVNPEKHGHVDYESALKLVEFFLSDDIQTQISEFGTDDYGQPLFFVQQSEVR